MRTARSSAVFVIFQRAFSRNTTVIKMGLYQGTLSSIRIPKDLEVETYLIGIQAKFVAEKPFVDVP